MDALVNGLPTVVSGNFTIIDTQRNDEGNVCTSSQVNVAKRKGWMVFDNNAGTSVEYAGSDETTTVSIIENTSKNSHRYSLDGRKQPKNPTKKGIYIVGGRKILVK